MNRALIALVFVTLLSFSCASGTESEKRGRRRLRLGAADKVALLVIDMQNCFIPGRPEATLGVAGGNDIIAPINKLIDTINWDLVVYTQDWHTPDHISFGISHKSDSCIDPANGATTPCGEFKLFNMSTYMQMLWPVHCVAKTPGAALVDGLHTPKTSEHITVYKGEKQNVDSYSGFVDNDKSSETPLAAELAKRGITTAFAVGLAADYCVQSTAVDAVGKGLKSFMITDASRAVVAAQLPDKLKEVASKSVGLIDTENTILSFSGTRWLASYETDKGAKASTAFAKAVALAQTVRKGASKFLEGLRPKKAQVSPAGQTSP